MVGTAPEVVGESVLASACAELVVGRLVVGTAVVVTGGVDGSSGVELAGGSGMPWHCSSVSPAHGSEVVDGAGGASRGAVSWSSIHGSAERAVPFPSTEPHDLFVMAFGLSGSPKRGAASGSQVRATGSGARAATGATGRADILVGNGIDDGATRGGRKRGGGALHAPIASISPDNAAATA
ncbi:hypothetical protein [Saccharopolyspora elongata]|uniref:Uncharacterized protein n=1 Tax=Saccharopolyspora elongata TaxID=2530387 RepID=A0A4R4Z6X6_9PSEU|nr:hypothetical protein [Saccharopolyspora elongata]TDD54011.1 hypothetical protein E1288_08400 [Saccharopolyspora elongata]